MLPPACLPYTAPAREGGPPCSDAWDGVALADAAEGSAIDAAEGSAVDSAVDAAEGSRASAPGRQRLVSLLYSEIAVPAGPRDGEYAEGGWTREHAWPQSRGAGRMGTGAPGMGTDLHNLFAADQSVNSARGNKHFAELPGGMPVVDRSPLLPGSDGRLLARASARAWEPPDGCKGAVARALLYMACQYSPDGLRLVDGFGEGPGELGRLSDVLAWNARFAPTARERRRNDVVEGLQGNRNPFVDDPGAADSIAW